MYIYIFFLFSNDTLKKKHQHPQLLTSGHFRVLPSIGAGAAGLGPRGREVLRAPARGHRQRGAAPPGTGQDAEGAVRLGGGASGRAVFGYLYRVNCSIVCMCICMYMYVYVCICTSMYMYVYVYMYTFIYIYM